MLITLALDRPAKLKEMTGTSSAILRLRILNSVCCKVSQVSHKAPKLQCATNSSVPYLNGKNQNARQLFTLNKTLHFRPQHRKDKVSENYTLVYQNSQGPQLTISRILSTAVGLTGPGLALWYLSASSDHLQSWQLYACGGVCLLCAAAVASVNVLARLYLIRIYMNESESRFIGIYQSFLGRSRQIDYSLEDVRPPVQGKLKPIHAKATVKVKDRRFHLKAADFVLPKYYNAHLRLR